jgi:hypothetical protein
MTNKADRAAICPVGFIAFEAWASAFFRFVVGVAFLKGLLRKSECQTWCFDGHIVVGCVVNVVSEWTHLAVEKYATLFDFIF